MGLREGGQGSCMYEGGGGNQGKVLVANPGISGHELGPKATGRERSLPQGNGEDICTLVNCATAGLTCNSTTSTPPSHTLCRAGLCCAGGTSLLAQMRERLELDICAAATSGTKVKVTAPVNPTERRYATWIGALWLKWHCRLSQAYTVGAVCRCTTSHARWKVSCQECTMCRALCGLFPSQRCRRFVGAITVLGIPPATIAFSSVSGKGTWLSRPLIRMLPCCPCITVPQVAASWPPWDLSNRCGCRSRSTMSTGPAWSTASAPDCLHATTASLAQQGQASTAAFSGAGSWDAGG
jgi:hypothetical protein